MLLGARRFYVGYIESNWGTVAERDAGARASELRDAFEKYQRGAERSTARVASLPEIEAQFRSYSASSREQLFELLNARAPRSMVLEAFDTAYRSLAWSGGRGPGVPDSQFRAQASAFITQGPLYSQLIIVVPVIIEGRTAGYIAGKRLFDVNFPISNRFINKDIFTTTFSARSNLTVEFDCSQDAKPRDGTQFLSVPLRSIDGQMVGYAYCDRPTLPFYLEQVRDLSERVIGVLAVLILAFAAIALEWYLRSLHWNGFRKLIVRSGILWILRYSLVWLNFPAIIFGAEYFSPDYFASPFGFGIAKSLGDLLITSIVLALNVALIAGQFFRFLSRTPKVRGSVRPWRKPAAYALVTLLGFLFFLILRGYAATVLSTVFDSTLNYTDPTSALPAFPVGLMLISLMLIGMSLVVVLSGIVMYSLRVLSGAFGNNNPKKALLGIITLYLLGSILFGMLQDNPLLGQVHRMIIVFAVMAVSVWINRTRPITLIDLRTAGILMLAAAIILMPRLNSSAAAFERSRIELLANEIIRPADSWLTYVVNQALDELSDQQIAVALSEGDAGDIEKLAFNLWAKSILSREGYNCSVSFIDWHGDIVSDFHIGLTPHSYREQPFGVPSVTRSVTVQDIKTGSKPGKWYLGYTPIVTDQGTLMGGLWVEVSAGRLSLLRGEAPEILRNIAHANAGPRPGKLVYSEYSGGKLVYTSAQNIPLEHQLPHGLSANTGQDAGIWQEENIDGVPYQTYFLQRNEVSSNNEWIALGFEEPEFRSQLVVFLRPVLFYLLAVLVLAVIVYAVRAAKGRKPFSEIRMKLMAAFITVSLIPVLILAYYNRNDAARSTEQAILRELQDQSSVVAVEIQKRLEMKSTGNLTDQECETISNDIGADFNVYLGPRIEATSKPEMFTAEVLGQTLNGPAYLNIVLRKRGFYSEKQSIGTLPYVVGYRPLTGADSSVRGVVSVPTLYRESDINEDLSKRNAFLFGAYALAMGISLLIGTIFANQMSAPLRRLKLATQQIAAGNLDVKLKTGRGDEVGELEEAVEKMAHDLKSTQQQMLRVQRELAWKEMAKQVAHEIKNPLTPMKLSLQHLRQAYKDGVKEFGAILQQVSDTILDQIEALSRIASEFSRFARMPDRSIETCALHQILTEAKHLFERYPRITFSLDLDRASPLVAADKEELQRVFINVIRNAVQAMEERGSLTLRTRLEGATVEIRISDTGPGIPEEYRARLFEPNFSTKTDGMGLGLAIVKKAVDDMNGSIEIESIFGSGTTVVIRLPLIGIESPR